MAVATIIGGAGRMGSWLATFLSRSGYEVIVTDRDRQAARRLARVRNFRYVDDQYTAIRDAEIIILATPTHITQRILQRLDRNISKDKLFVEISSVKQPLRSVLRDTKKRGISVLSIHPLFGSGAGSMRNRTILVMPITPTTRLVDSFLGALRRKGARLVKCNFNEHDKLISIVLTLPHFVNAAFVNALRSLKVDSSVLSKLAGPTFKLQLLIAQAVHQENLANEISVLMDSSYSITALKQSTQATKRMMDMIMRGNRGMMLQTLGMGRRYLQKSSLFSSAYDRFNEAVSVSSSH